MWVEGEGGRSGNRVRRRRIEIRKGTGQPEGSEDASANGWQVATQHQEPVLTAAHSDGCKTTVCGHQ